MKKIPTIFKRDFSNKGSLLNELNPYCVWVFNGEGVATRKYDGTCVKLERNKYFKRREVKKGKKIPDGFIEEEFDKNTGKHIGWIEVDINDKSNKWHIEALRTDLKDGTYELLGPKIQGNPEKYDSHFLIKHSEAVIFLDMPRNFNGIKQFLADKDIEGIVFHHPDGRMAKIKKRDFGQIRIPKETKP